MDREILKKASDFLIDIQCYMPKSSQIFSYSDVDFSEEKNIKNAKELILIFDDIISQSEGLKKYLKEQINAE